MRNSSWYISRGALAVILNGAKRSEESKAFARKTALSWDETLWILRVVYPELSRRAQNDIQRNCRAGYAKVSESRNPEEPYTPHHLDSRPEPAPYPDHGVGNDSEKGAASDSKRGVSVRIAIYGAGAIGAYLGAKLALGGQDVTLIARGAHLKAMQANGVTVLTAQGELQAHPSATDDPDAVGAVDFLFLTVKAHSLTEIAPLLKPLIGPETALVSAQNGIPWWYFQRHGGEWDGTRLESVDPGGVISEAIDPERIIGCIDLPRSGDRGAGRCTSHRRGPLLHR